MADEDKALETFGLAKKVQRILREQQGKLQAKKHAQHQEEEEETVSKKQQTKKRHEESRPFCLVQYQWTHPKTTLARRR